MANRFDHSSTLPRKPSITDAERCRVYFIAGAGLVKIGCSTNVVSRLRAIRNSSPVPVEMVCLIKGGTLEEAFLHDEFAKDRRHGEWFTDSSKMRARIAELQASPRAVPLPATAKASRPLSLSPGEGG